MPHTSFNIDDLFLHRKVSDLQVAPDGRTLACVLRSVDREQDGYITSLWELPLASGTPRQLTQGPGQDNTPRWSPGGDQLAFVSSRAGTPGVHLLPREGGEARAVGKLPGAVSDLRWTPDGHALVLTAAVPVDPDWRGERPAGRQPKDHPAQPQVAWKLPYKSDGLGYMLRREIHLFHLELASGHHRQLTDGAFDVLAFDVAPDGRQLAWSQTRAGRFAHRTDLWCGDLQGGAARQLTRDFATVMSPAWSPDGRSLAFSATREEGDAQIHLFVLDLASGQVRQLGGEDLQVADPPTVRWSADGRHLLCAQARHGRHRIVRVDAAACRVEVLCPGDRQLGASPRVVRALRSFPNIRRWPARSGCVRRTAATNGA